MTGLRYDSRVVAAARIERAGPRGLSLSNFVWLLVPAGRSALKIGGDSRAQEDETWQERRPKHPRSIPRLPSAHRPQQCRAAGAGEAVLTRPGYYGCWPVLMAQSRPEASTLSIRFHLARAHWRALRGRHVLAVYGLGSGIENSKDSRSEDHSTLRKWHVWQLASARPYYLRSYPRPLPIPRKLSGK